MADDVVFARVDDRSVVRRVASGVVNDSLYRNSTFLILNSVLVSGVGFVFWTIAARAFTADAVGTTTTVISAVTYASMMGAVGLPNTVIRFLACDPDPVRLLATVGFVATASGALVGLAWWAMPGHFGIPLANVASGGAAIGVIAAAVALGSLGAVAQAAIIALRKSKWVVVENAAGSSFKLAALPLAAGFGAAGLFGVYVGSLLVSAAVSIVIVFRLVGGGLGRWLRSVAPRSVAHVRTFAAGNHVAALASTLPDPVVRVVVLAQLGARQAAFLAIPLMIIAMLNVIPGISSQSLFAEAAADEASLARHARRALQGIYVLLLPAIAGLVIFAHPLLSIFGHDYAAEGTRCLQLLALSGLFAGVSYVADTVLNAQRRVAEYVFVNLVGSAGAIVLPILFVDHGLTGVGFGWLLGQIAYCTMATSILLARRRFRFGWQLTRKRSTWS